MRRPQDGAFFKGPPYPGYPFLMIPDLSSPYLPNGPLSPGGARTVSVRPAAPGRAGGRGSRDASPGSATGWGMGPSREDPGQNLLTELNHSGSRGLGCAGSAWNIPLHSPLWLGSRFGVHFWRSPWCPEFFARAREKLGFVPVGRECVLSGAWRGEVVLLSSWKSVRFLWQLGSGARGGGLATLPRDSSFSGRLEVGS